jgi:Zn-dependent M16 (insulinase) family peptidase
MGTEKEDYVSLTQRISRKSGGIRPALSTSVVKNSEQGSVWLFLRGKAVNAQTTDLLSILEDVLLSMRLDNRDRFRQMVLEAKARQEQKIIPGGNQMVALRLRAHFTEADWASEQMNGVSYLFFLRKLSKAVDEDWKSVLDDLEEIRRRLINRNGMLLNVTTAGSGNASPGDSSWPRLQTQVNAFLQNLPASPFETAEWDPEKIPEHEGLTIPAQVNYVGKGLNLYQSGYQFHGSAQVVSRYVRNAWLWERVRVQGGAYGAHCLFNRLSGVLTFVSYRDPNLIKTLDAFNETAGFLDQVRLNDEELTKSIIGAIGDLDQYRLPDAKGYISMIRHLSGETDEDRQRMREEILNTQTSHYRDFGRYLASEMERGLVKILGSRSAIDEALEERPGWLNVTRVL